MSGERNPNYGLSPSVDESYNGITTSVIPLIKKQKQLNKLYSEKNQQLASILITFVGTKYERGGFSYDEKQGQTLISLLKLKSYLTKLLHNILNVKQFPFI